MKKKIFILMPIILIIILIYMDFINYLRVGDIQRLYLENWKINLLNPSKIKYIIREEGIDSTRFVIMYYKKDKVNKLVDNKVLKKVEQNELNQVYDKLINNYFLNFLDDKDQKLFNKEFNKEKLFNDDNYYILLEKGNMNEVGYCFELLFLDTKSNVLYSIVSTS